MQKTFIEQVINEVIGPTSANDYSDLHVVFPTRRAALIFKTKFAAKLSAPAFLPNVFSIGDFIADHSPLAIADRKELLLELYIIYLGFFPGTTYSAYAPWGEMILNDFDEIERYCVSAPFLYAGIKSLKEIENLFENDPEQAEQIKKFWGLFTEKEPSALKKKFLLLWDALPLMYESLTGKLELKRKITEGRALLSIAQDPGNYLQKIKPDKIVMAGFYALTTAEQLLFEYIYKNNGRLLWDADSYFTDDAHQEAGFYFRNNPFTKNKFKWKENLISGEKKNITVSGTPLAAGQVKHLASVLQQQINDKNFEAEKTVIILPDETMLNLLLQSLPSEIKDLNITMGFPFTETLLYRFLQSCEALKKQAQVKKGMLMISGAAWNSVLSHPYARAFFNEERFAELSQKNHFIPVTETGLTASHPLFILLEKDKNAASVFNSYIDILQFIVDHVSTQSDSSPKEIVSFILHELKELYALTHPYVNAIDGHAAEMLIKDVFEKTRLPFSGEPVKGLQVMGFLETRTLDFENVFIINVNEGSLPRLNKHNSFIPYTLRKGFGLPTYEEQDAISSYHFWRLMLRGKNVHLIYNTQVNDFAGGEKSRYLLQLFYEMQPVLKNNLLIRHEVVSTPLLNYKTEKPQFPRTSDLTKNLLSVFTGEKAKPFSATSLQTFINCSLQFYFRYIKGIKEPDEVVDEIDGARFGEIFHGAAAEVYSAHAQQIFTTETAGEIKTKINSAVFNAIKKYFNPHYNKTGYAYLIQKIIERYIENIVQIDMQSHEFSPVAFEETYETNMLLTENTIVKLKGQFDRVDKLEKSFRIVDYKTGNDAVENPKSTEDIFNDTKFKINLQLMLYTWLARRNNFTLPVNAGIYPLRRISSGIEMVSEGNSISENEMTKFEEGLTNLLNVIIYKADFIQTEDVKKCQFCAYRPICNR